MKRNITIRFSASGKTNPKEWESKVTIEGEGPDEDEAEKVAIRKFKAEHGNVPYTVDRNAAVEAFVLNASVRLLAASIEETVERIRRQSDKMDKVSRTSPEYESMQYEMQRLLKTLRQLDPSGSKTPFDHKIWIHTGKPRSKTRLLSDTEDPLSTGVVFDTLIDGEPSAATPAVQTVTKSDGSIEQAPEQELLNDDLVVPSIKFG